LATNSFNDSGAFSITNPAAANAAQQYFLLQLP
jgi:hypothetical protein